MSAPALSISSDTSESPTKTSKTPDEHIRNSKGSRGRGRGSRAIMSPVSVRHSPRFKVTSFWLHRKFYIFPTTEYHLHNIYNFFFMQFNSRQLVEDDNWKKMARNWFSNWFKQQDWISLASIPPHMFVTIIPWTFFFLILLLQRYSPFFILKFRHFLHIMYLLQLTFEFFDICAIQLWLMDFLDLEFMAG